MPYKTRKVRKNCYKVYKPKDKKVFAKCTSKENARKQIVFFVLYNLKNLNLIVKTKLSRNVNNLFIIYQKYIMKKFLAVLELF